MALAGPAFLVLFVVAMALQGDAADEGSNGKEVISRLAEHHDKAVASVFLAAPLVGLLLLFAGALRTAFADAGGGAKRLFQYGAVLYAAGLLLGATLTLGLVDAVKHKQENAAEALNVLATSAWIPVVAGAAVLLLGAGLATLQSDVLPAWLGWVALVVGVVAFLGPGGFVGFLVAPLWIGVAGVLLYLRRDETASLPA